MLLRDHPPFILYATRLVGVYKSYAERNPHIAFCYHGWRGDTAVVLSVFVGIPTMKERVLCPRWCLNLKDGWKGSRESLPICRIAQVSFSFPQRPELPQSVSLMEPKSTFQFLISSGNTIRSGIHSPVWNANFLAVLIAVLNHIQPN